MKEYTRLIVATLFSGIVIKAVGIDVDIDMWILILISNGFFILFVLKDKEAQ